MSIGRGIVAKYKANNPYIIKVSSTLPLAMVLTAECEEGIYCFDSPEDALESEFFKDVETGNLKKYLELGVNEFPVIVPIIVSVINIKEDEALMKSSIIEAVNALRKASSTINKASKKGEPVTYKPDIIIVPDYHVGELDICNPIKTVCEYLGARTFFDADAELNSEALAFRANFTSDRITLAKCGLGKWNTTLNQTDFYCASAVLAFLRVYIDGQSTVGYAKSISNRILPFSSVKYPVEFIAGKQDETDSLTEKQIMSFISHNGIRSWEYATCTNTIWKDARRVRIFDLAAQATVDALFEAVDKDIDELMACKRALENFMADLVGQNVMVDGFKVYLDTKQTTQTSIDEGRFYLMVDCDDMPSPRLIEVTYNKVSQSAEKIYKMFEEA
ncbi:phage tail sheath protein [Aliarcobacter butzleri JV22]|uniref:tail protein n=1 Tax=Aliarcobacter butzleri TaxID=28197 RepID=UPI0001F14509|nr:tail protein [Aliarcobacter butzleri]EFU69119.1 phage tail sheath protein [Aliarcobacter butzleri JV22]